MSKIGVGIGVEFPADDSKPAEAPEGDRRKDERDAECAKRREAHRKWREQRRQWRKEWRERSRAFQRDLGQHIHENIRRDVHENIRRNLHEKTDLAISVRESARAPSRCRQISRSRVSCGFARIFSRAASTFRAISKDCF